MRQVISTILAVHWAAVFGLLAFLCAAEPHAGAGSALRAFGLAVAENGVAGGARLAALLALAFALAASLFLWMLAECVFGRIGEANTRIQENCRTAFAGGVLALLLFLCFGALAGPADGLLLTVECAVAAVLISYLAVCAEQVVGSLFKAEESGAGDAARSMALGAAHATLLSRISGRSGETPAGRL